MKAVILERRGTEAAVLAENGAFIKVPCFGEIGEEIDIAKNVTPMPRFGQRLKRGLAAAALVLVVAGSAYHYTAVSVSAYVSVDAGDSSLEMKVNRFGQIISVESVTGNDSALAETISSEVHGMSVEDAVGKALDTLAENGKLSDENKPVIVGITSESENGAESLENAISQRVELPIYTVRVSEEEREEAHRKELGGGRYVYDRVETANTLSVNDTDETEEDVISIFVPITEKENADNENDAAEKAYVPETEQEKITETISEEKIVRPPEPASNQINNENAALPERPDNSNDPGNMPTQGAQTKQPAAGSEQRPQTPETEMTGEMPKNSEAALPQQITENDKQSGEVKPPEMPSVQNGKQPAPPDNAGQPPEQSNAAPANGIPPDAGAAGQQAASGQMPPVLTPMDGQQNMMPPDQ